MKQLIIIGARGWGREVYNIAKSCIAAGEHLQIKGFLDDKKDALDKYMNYPPIISSVEEYQPHMDDVFVCALGEPFPKRKYVNIIAEKGGTFVNLIHPSSHIGDNVIMGEGCIIAFNSVIGQDTKIGSYVTFDGSGSVGHDCVIGDFCHISGQTSVAGFTKVGENVLIHPGVRIVPHRKIGNNAIIGVGSIVINNVKANDIVFGNPARVIDQISDK